MISQYQLTYIEAAEAAAARGKPRCDKPWQNTCPSEQTDELSNSVDTTEHTVSSTHEDSSDNFVCEDLRPLALPSATKNTPRGLARSPATMTAPIRKSAKASQGAVSSLRSFQSTKSNSRIGMTTLPETRRSKNFDSFATAASLESRLMQRYKMTYKEALVVTSKAKKAASRRHCSVEEICHEIINGVESDFRCVKLRPVKVQSNRADEKVSSPRVRAFESLPKTKAETVVMTEPDSPLPTQSKTVSATPCHEHMSSPISSYPKKGKTVGLKKLSESQNADGDIASATSRLPETTEPECRPNAVPGKGKLATSKFLEASRRFPFGSVSTANQLPQSLLMQQFYFSYAVANRLAETARVNVGLPPWIPTSPALLEECHRLASSNDGATPQPTRTRTTLPVVLEDTNLQPKPSISDEPEAEDETGSPSSILALTSYLNSSTNEASSLNSPINEASSLDSPIDETSCYDLSVKKQALITREDNKGQGSFDAHPEIETPKDNHSKQSILCGRQTSRPLETILAQRHGIPWREAKSIVQKGRLLLDMAHTLAWSTELERLCEEKCVALTGNHKGTSSELETLSVVYSVDVKDLSECATEIGKSWVSYSIEECLLVSRCPSRNQDVIYVESASCRSSGSTQSMTSEAFDIPCLIYIRADERPEIPEDEPLEAVLGIPFLGRQRSKRRRKRLTLSTTNTKPTIYQRLVATIMSKATGRLSSNSSECRRRTLVDL